MTSTTVEPEHAAGVWMMRPHRDASCYAALFAEITGDAFPHPGKDACQWAPQDALNAASEVMAIFAGAVACGDHGPGCPERAEFDADLAAYRASKAAATDQDAHD